jgi:acetyltransferase
MSTYRLENLFAPRSVALVGTSPRERSVGRMILRNLREAGFAGAIELVNPKYSEIEGIRTGCRRPGSFIIVILPAALGLSRPHSRSCLI